MQLYRFLVTAHIIYFVEELLKSAYYTDDISFGSDTIFAFLYSHKLVFV